MDVTVQFKFKLPYRTRKRAKWVVASCPILDVHSQGETEAKAKKNLEEALVLFFISCFERGTLDTALKQCGFRPLYSPLPHKGKRPSSRAQFIDVPLPFIIDQNGRPGCPA